MSATGSAFRPGPSARLALLAALVGVAAGLGAVAFYFALNLTASFVQGMLIGFRAPEVLGEPSPFHFALATYRPWLWLLVTPLGAGLSAWMVFRWAPEAAGHGTDAAIEAYHTKDGFVRTIVPFVKGIASAILIGSGGAAGPEGPISQIGAGFGSWLGRMMNLDAPGRRALMAAGMGAGVGAIFKAPLAGALFAGEILYSTLQIEHEIILPSLVASICSFSVFGSVVGWDPIFKVPDVHFTRPLELIPYAALGLAAALLGGLFVKVFYGIEHAAKRLPLSPVARVILGGVATGLVAMLLTPSAVGSGYGELQEAIIGHRSAGKLLAFAVLRVFTTSFSVGTGGSGGIFGPSLVIGGCLGGSLGVFFYKHWPLLVPDPGAFALVGMTGFFAGIAHAPISTIIMVCEATGNYELLVPAILVCVLTFLIAGRWSLYEKQLAGAHESPVHRAEFGAVLDEQQVAAYMNAVVESFGTEQLLAAAREAAVKSRHHGFPVLDAQGRPVGLMRRDQMGRADDAELSLRHVSERMEPIRIVTPTTTLGEAARILVEPSVRLLAVADPAHQDRLVGVMTRSDVLRAYHDGLRLRFGRAKSGPVRTRAAG